MGIMIEEDLKIKPSICDELKEEILFLSNEEKQVIVHCSIYAMDYGDAARIWKSTYLVDKESGVTYKLIFAEGISFAPQWTLIPFQKPLEFTLIFKGLPKSCKSFDLVEMIPEDGGFEVLNISRNTADVYYVTI
ncbi:hypothetical protein MG290_12635 [Flavobacterium sp. CBA20B-1]|uniref:hypothetical protein n=1 Tax=unclassified Flavobacterium TaxID=196869 RepID=UPI0022240769|nr:MULTISPECIES: hypothetical protein [unclassified Flavobacterium]WCM41776.1 hypothetical protein MG290_12635 [Flavobacterium sp. CBA20B-1]